MTTVVNTSCKWVGLLLLSAGLAHTVAVSVLVQGRARSGGAAGAGVESLVQEEVTLRAEHLHQVTTSEHRTVFPLNFKQKANRIERRYNAVQYVKMLVSLV